MGLKSTQKYDSDKIDKLGEHVNIYHEAGDPIEYEIIVDGFKAVRRTSDPKMFALYDRLVNGDTKSVEINFYHNNSNTYDKHIFTLDDGPGEGLSGTEIDQRIQENVQRERKQWEHELVRQENERLKGEVEALEKEVEELEKENEELAGSRSPLQGALGEFGSSFLESFIRRNPGPIAGLPGGEALAGMIEEDRRPKEQEPVTTVTFKAREESPPPALNDEQKRSIEFVERLKARFTKGEFDQVLLILQTLADDKAKIGLILNHVNIKDQTHE